MPPRTELTLRATTSNGIQFQLLSGTTPVNLTAVGTIELWRKDSSGGTSMTDNLTGKISINGAAGGSVLWTPGTADLVNGSAPYQAYFRVFVTSTSWYSVPEDSEFTVALREAF